MSSINGTYYFWTIILYLPVIQLAHTFKKVLPNFSLPYNLGGANEVSLKFL